jgi:hypothetical protein
LILIYSDSQIIDLEWLPRITFPDDYTVCHNFVEFQNSNAEYKLAFTTHRLHCDHDVNCEAYQGFEDKINQLSQISQCVFTIESELHNYHWQIWKQCHQDNVYWVLPGIVNDNEKIANNIIIWNDWFKTTTRIYKNLPDKLEQIDYITPKPKYFDALLGSAKPHRDFVHNSVVQSNLQDKFILTYGGKWDDNEFYAKDYFIWEDNVIPKQKIIGTADQVNYCGELAHLSQVIPIQVFNETAYSIIAETDHDNTLSCFTEKTAKPLIARRLFIVFSGYKFLYNLRRLGFQTFDGIIDESYDMVIDDDIRYAMAFNEVKKLCNLDQSMVLEKIRPIVEHNHNLIMHQDWTTYAAQFVTEVIKSLDKSSAH